MNDDPFEVLGLTRSAGLDEVRSARRRLAFDAHPDRGGDADRMQAINAAFDAAVAHLTGRRPLPSLDPPAPASSGSGSSPGPEPVIRAPRAAREPIVPRGRFSVEHDNPSFTIDALPAEAFEALLVVTTWIGEVLDDDPPYLLETRLDEPYRCWCRLDLVPDAGGSTVSISVAAEIGEPRPTAEAVRDLWVDQLNHLGDH